MSLIFLLLYFKYKLIKMHENNKYQPLNLPVAKNNIPQTTETSTQTITTETSTQTDNKTSIETETDTKEKSNISYLESVTYKNTKTYKPQILNNMGKCIKVYDGDTITIASRLENSLDKTAYRFNIRLLGIDTPEIRTSNSEEKEVAIKVRDNLKEMILGKNIMIERGAKRDKYGRILAHVYLPNDDYNWEQVGGGKDNENEFSNMTHINQYLIDHNMALEYNGGTKQKIDWQAYYKKE
jgi:micrococcal nuclease